MYDNLRKVLDFDDLLFESRNRDYGAYQLRKRYNSVVISGIILATVLVSAVVVLPFIFASHSDKVHTGGFNYVSVQMENLDPPIEEFIVPPSPPPPEAAHIQEIVKYTPPVIVDSVLPFEPVLATTDEFLAQSSSDMLEVSGTGTGEDLLSGQVGTETDEPFFLVEVMPSFKGGDINKFREWVQKRTNYPQIAIDNKIQGRVFLTFIVEPDGAVSSVTVVKGVDPIIDNEAVKSIQASPKWSPGLQRGQPVRVRYSMWLSFVF
jgi:protein TonB